VGIRKKREASGKEMSAHLYAWGFFVNTDIATMLMMNLVGNDEM